MAKTQTSPACQECPGRCCSFKGLGLHLVYLDPKETEHPKIQPHVDWISENGTKEKRGVLKLNPQCPLLDPNGNCSIYDTRPKACRNYVCHLDPRIVARTIVKNPEHKSLLQKWNLLPGQENGLSEPENLTALI